MWCIDIAFDIDIAFVLNLRNSTRNTMLPFQPYDVVTNLSKYHLNEDEMDLLKNGLDFSIQPRFLRKTDVFLPVWYDCQIYDAGTWR